ncbi:MAG TPA: AprI/Inh family metalloprotease inhibitor [Xanthobacteraceae bacterium]|nr:AprI/Inh family metalloprotease inhibitor [Xanthobacteraceae bacterium]
MRVSFLIALAFALAGCAGEQAVTGTTMVRPGAPPEPMAGRWVLASGPSQCGMNFGGTPEAPEGTIAPEGGCPGNFYTSRKWTFDQTGLIIRDHNGQPLAQLALAGPGRFEGKATAGPPVTLAR